MSILGNGKNGVESGGSAGYAGADNLINGYDNGKGAKIDLGFAKSPIGPAPELVSEFARHTSETSLALTEYSSDPYHTTTKNILLTGIGLTGLKPESVVFSPNGSYGAGDEMVRHLATRGYNTFLAPAYSFPNTKQWAIRNRVEYKPLPGDALDPSASLQAVLRMGRRELSRKIVYTDYPNNPTGIADPNLMRQVVEHVSRHGGMPMVDLAFGEVLGDEFRDAMQYTLDHGGIVLSSLSKTQGLPDLRAGYAIMSPSETARYTKAERLVFGLPAEAELAYQTLYQTQPDGSTLARVQADRATAYNVSTNQEFTAGLVELGLRVAPTDPRVPIQTVIAEKPDFYERLATHGIGTESLADYSDTLNLRRTKRGYGNAAVRMLTPKPGDLEPVLLRIKQALESPEMIDNIY